MNNEQKVVQTVVAILVAAALTIALVLIRESEDYSISGTIVQQFTIKDIDCISIACSCPVEVQIKSSHSDVLRLTISGTESSVGYHGNQEKPISIDKAQLQFDFIEKDRTLFLTSKEWIYMHHAFIVDKVKMGMPDNIDFQYEKVVVKELLSLLSVT